MVVDVVLFLGLAIVAVASALGMLLSRNAIYAALFLILNFSTVAIFYLILGAPFIALTQITVYAGAIMVLFLFVIMLLGAEQAGQRETSPWLQPLTIGLGALLAFETIYILFTHNSSFSKAADVVQMFGSPVSVGEMLFDKYTLPFEVTSVLLLAAMIGAIVLTKHLSKN